MNRRGPNTLPCGTPDVTLNSADSCPPCNGADGAVHHPHPKHDLRRGSQDHHPSKNSVQKTICCNSTSNAPDDGRMYRCLY